MCLHFLVHFDEGFGEMGLHQHKSKLGQNSRPELLPSILGGAIIKACKVNLANLLGGTQHEQGRNFSEKPCGK